MLKRIYMDYASTTPLDPRVLKAMMPYFTEKFGNPSSIHTEGVAAKKALDEARKNVALILQAHADEIVFTSGGTESNNLAIFGSIVSSPPARGGDKEGVGANTKLPRLADSALPLSKEGVGRRRPHIITTNIEHSSVLEPIRELERRGAAVTYVSVEPSGIVDPKKIAIALRPETVLVSVHYANNEIGTIQPILKIAKQIQDLRFNPPERPASGQAGIQGGRKKQLPIFHVDASQAPLYLDCMVERLGVDLMTLDGHKMYGPKGVGMLYVRRGTVIAPTMWGGGQERGMRPTTENVPAIIGFAKALELAVFERDKESSRFRKLRDFCHSNILQNVGMTEMIINGDMKNRLPNNINISIATLDTEFALLQLDAAGIACSTKSSCLGTEGGSYVVEALGNSGGISARERGRRALRFTFGRDTTKKDVERIISCLVRILNRTN